MASASACAALVGDRGMIAQTRIDADLKPAGFDWITALRGDAIRKLVQRNVIQPSLFDTPDLASVTCDDYPGERLLVRYNPLVAAERRRKRKALLDLTETEAEQLAAGYAAGRYDRDEFNRRLSGLRERRMGKHFEWTFDEETEAFTSRRKAESIRAEERLDGIYVIRTSLQQDQLGDAETVRAYKSLARVKRAFRSMKSLLAVRPVFHWKERRVRAQLLICMLAYYLEWHMRERLAPLLFVDDQRPAGGLPLQSFESLLANLATVSAVELRLQAAPQQRVSMLSALTPEQERAFELPGIKPHPAPLPEPARPQSREPRHQWRVFFGPDCRQNSRDRNVSSDSN